MLKKSQAVALLLVPALALAACGSSSDSKTTASSGGSGTSSGGQSKKELKIAILSPAPRNDGGLTQFTIEGAKEAAGQIGAKINAINDNVSDPQQQIRSLRNLAQSNDIIILSSGSLNQATETVAPKFPKVHFIQFLAPTKTFHDNVTAVVPQLGLNAIVAGAVMANKSKSKKLGFVSGLEIPASQEEYVGIKQGATLTDPKATVAKTFTGDYNDVGKAKQAGQAQINNGVDQILGDLDSGIRGLEGAAESGNAGIYQVFGLDCSASKNVVGSARVSFGAIAGSSLKAAAKGSLKPGALFITLKDSSLMKFDFCPGKATASDKKVAADMTQKINSGQVQPEKGVVDPNPGYAVVYK